MHGGSGVDEDQIQAAISAGCSKINYYSYMAKACSKHINNYLAEREGNAYWHEVQEEAYTFMKEYIKGVLNTFKNGK